MQVIFVSLRLVAFCMNTLHTGILSTVQKPVTSAIRHCLKCFCSLLNKMLHDQCYVSILHIDPVYFAASAVTYPAVCPCICTATYIHTITEDFTDVHWLFRNANSNALIADHNYHLVTRKWLFWWSKFYCGRKLSFITEPLAESIRKSGCVPDKYSSIFFCLYWMQQYRHR